MHEPTIDEMLDWLDSRSAPIGYTNTQLNNAIRAILEQQQRVRDNPLGQVRVLAAIRAFVERVDKRAKLVSVSKFHYAELIEDELAAIEKEANDVE